MLRCNVQKADDVLLLLKIKIIKSLRPILVCSLCYMTDLL